MKKMRLLRIMGEPNRWVKSRSTHCQGHGRWSQTCLSGPQWFYLLTWVQCWFTVSCNYWFEIFPFGKLCSARFISPPLYWWSDPLVFDDIYHFTAIQQGRELPSADFWHKYCANNSFLQLPSLVSSLEHRFQSLDTFRGYTIGTSHEWQMQTSFLSQRLAWYLDR